MMTIHGTTGVRMRTAKWLVKLGFIAALGGAFATSRAADLTIADGVTVKFGADAQLVVRDRLTAGQGVVLTSQKDDSVAGQTGASAQTPAAGDWLGIRLEKSTTDFGALTLTDLAVRYGGAGDGAGMTLRGFSPTLQFLQWTDNTVGLRLLEGASPSITGSSFLRNVTGLEADDNSAPSVTGGQFSQNTAQAILNKTPAAIIQATGDWWGNASGPKDPAANPQGLGDTVSAGVSYGGYLTAQPMIHPTVRLAAPASFFEQREIALDVSCPSAAEYRLAEGGVFTGAFQPLSSGRASTSFTVSDGDGSKSISVQFRNAVGVETTATLAGGVLVDTQPPTIAFNNPAAGSVLTLPITLEATAADSAGVARVEFYVDTQLIGSDSASPYSIAWDPSSVAGGNHTLKVVALDAIGRTSQQLVAVTVVPEPRFAVCAGEGGFCAFSGDAFVIYGAGSVFTAPRVFRNGVSCNNAVFGDPLFGVVKQCQFKPVGGPADTDGPQLTNAAFNGAPLANGSVFTGNSSITVSATDRSGISRVELLLDDQVVSAASGSSSYSAALNLANVANGPHTLAIRAADSLSNTTTAAYGIVVAHAPPAAPVITQPASGLTTRTTSTLVSGTAQASSSVQVLVGGQPAGVPVAAGADGRFVATVDLTSGANQIRATAADQYGTSELSTAILVTVDSSIPSSPSNLTALSLVQGKVRLSWVRSSDPKAIGYDIYRSSAAFNETGEALKINGSPLTTASVFDDLPALEGVWFYRVVAVNSLGTPSVPTNQAQGLSDSTPPKATSIVYTPLGKTDPATGRVGQGRVNLVLTTSEALPAAPFLSIVPAGGGAPLPIDLVKATDTTYSGFFVIDASTASGTANALFSARDAAGNRGTNVDAGATLNIDAQGPALSSIAVTPNAPIRNDAAPTIQATFTFSEATKAGATPQISYLLSRPGRQAVPVAGLTQLNPTTWRASFTLLGDAGQGSPENLSFSFQALDDLDNASTTVAGANRFQVYQGNLPPLDVPLGFTAKAQPGGKVKLSWQAVTDAFAYQLYRQGPGQTDLQPLGTRASGVSFIDQTPQDGSFVYAVASVRQSNDQEAISGQSSQATVLASATPPAAPQNFALALTGQGIRASWAAPLAGTVDSYNLYRSTGTAITSIAGLTPYKTLIRAIPALDASPSPSESAYVVTALDAAGNESAISNSAFLNASLLPVGNLRIEQIGAALPKISWTAPAGGLAGYVVYVGPDSAKVKLTPTPITSLFFIDTGYTGGERRYTVASVDVNGVELPRSLTLPNAATSVASSLTLQRGVMNKMQVQITNTSGEGLVNARIVVRVPINRDATVFQDHRSPAFDLGATETRLVPVIVGGYADLPGRPQVEVGVEIAPEEGEFVKVSRSQTVDVSDSGLVVGIATEEFTRAATGKVKLSIENTSEVEVELLTAVGGGTGDSSELRFKILDADGNVLATQSYRQAFGANVVALVNGQTVARIPPGTSFVSDPFSLNVPAASPAAIRVKLEIDKLRYHSGQEDEILIAGRGAEKTVSLTDTAYAGEVTTVAPVSSFGDQDVIIAGRALDRATGTQLPNARLKLILNQEGFERNFSVLTDATGGFTYTFKPTFTDGGLYKVSAVHPDITDRPEQKAFTINRVALGPTPFQLDVPRGYTFNVPFIAKAGPGTSAANVRFELNPASQPTGQLPAGVSVQLPAPISIAERQTLNVPVVFSANSDAQPSGALIFDVFSDEHLATPLTQVRLNYSLSEAKPFVTATPSFIETGLAQGESQTETLTVENKGLQDALNLRFTLTKGDGTPAPDWISIPSNPDGTLAIGQKRAIDLTFTPPAGTQDGVYEFKLTVQGDNVAAQSLSIFASVTQAGQGNVTFKASDIFTATVDKQGHVIQGLAGATVTLQNEDVITITQQLVTDSLGEAAFQGVPAGRYKFRATASKHQEVGGRIQIKPGITLNQSIFLETQLITVEWSVREVTIQDRYEITLNSTFETDVPTAVVVMQPASTNLPKMNPGDVFFGELVITNFGLVRADGLTQQLPQPDPFFRFEFLSEIPRTLDAKQRVTIPYRVVALQPLEPVAGAASGGGCYNYSNTSSVKGTSTCANGFISQCGGSTSWFSFSNSTCGGGGGGTGSTGSIGGGGASWLGGQGNGFVGTSSPGTAIKLRGKKCVFIPDGKGTECFSRTIVESP